MKIFITGVGSFIGKAFVRWCDAQGHEIVGVDLVSVDRDDCHIGDIRVDNFEQLIPQDVDAIVHLAAISRDPDCRGKAYDCFQTNVMSTIRLMDAGQKKGAKQFIFASSEWVYTDYPTSGPATEETQIDIQKHKSEYALSKLVSEANLRQYAMQGAENTTILRFGIVYGPREKNWCAVEGLLNQVVGKNEITVGSARTARCFIHVDDVAAGIGAAIGAVGFQIYNIQGSRPVDLGEVVHTSARLLNRQVKLLESSPETPSIRWVSGAKAKKDLQWEPTISFADGLQSVIDFLGLK